MADVVAYYVPTTYPVNLTGTEDIATAYTKVLTVGCYTSDWNNIEAQLPQVVQAAEQLWNVSDTGIDLSMTMQRFVSWSGRNLFRYTTHVSYHLIETSTDTVECQIFCSPPKLQVMYKDDSAYVDIAEFSGISSISFARFIATLQTLNIPQTVSNNSLDADNTCKYAVVSSNLFDEPEVSAFPYDVACGWDLCNNLLLSVYQAAPAVSVFYIVQLVPNPCICVNTSIAGIKPVSGRGIHVEPINVPETNYDYVSCLAGYTLPTIESFKLKVGSGFNKYYNAQYTVPIHAYTQLYDLDTKLDIQFGARMFYQNYYADAPVTPGSTLSMEDLQGLVHELRQQNSSLQDWMIPQYLMENERFDLGEGYVWYDEVWKLNISLHYTYKEFLISGKTLGKIASVLNTLTSGTFQLSHSAHTLDEAIDRLDCSLSRGYRLPLDDISTQMTISIPDDCATELYVRTTPYSYTTCQTGTTTVNISDMMQLCSIISTTPGSLVVDPESESPIFVCELYQITESIYSGAFTLQELIRSSDPEGLAAKIDAGSSFTATFIPSN